ncbi:hypothetical protein UFOVP389_23 [uncultured Caudovirales phage]|uniref:Uncharacterized protein n=1 Tax=uncultured Caudovirales phage TaxID=2100421 RepID=A0A6J7X3R8_9CAUD|nr:hypothetical protein UFOVP389_23 [uncultured Caudovirales phage]
MTFPTGTVISTANVDSPDDDPSLARGDIYNLIVAVNQLIASVNAANGVLSLDSGGKISTSFIPGTITVSGDQTLSPTNGIISLRNVLRMRQIQFVQLGSMAGTTSPSAGDIVYLTDGDAGNPCLAVYNGSQWRTIRLGTQVGPSGAALTSAFTLTATAVP